MTVTPERNGAVTSGAARSRKRANARRTAVDGGRRNRRGKATGVDVGAGLVARRIRRRIEACPAPEVGGLLAALVKHVGRGAGGPPRRARVIAWVEHALDEAARRDVDATRWTLDEASVWAAAWLARNHEGDEAVDQIVERLVREATVAAERFAAGDTTPACFVIALSRLFQHVESCRAQEAAVVAALSGSLAALVAPSGAVALAGSTAMLERMVHWSDCREGALATGGLPWDEAGERLWSAATGVAVRLLGGRGRILAGAGRRPGEASRPLVDAIDDGGGAGVGVPGRLRRALRVLRGRRCDGRLPVADFHDAEAGLTIIRSGWEPAVGGVPGLRVLLDHREATPWLEVAVDDRLLVCGPWAARVRVGGRAREPQEPWTVEAWEPGRKVSFIEISAPLGAGMRLDRHLVVLHRQGIVLAGDAVVARTGGPQAASPPRMEPHGGNGRADAAVGQDDAIEYEGTVPLAAELEAEAAAETREVVLADARVRGTVLPLALPEWRAGGGGSFDAGPGGLVLRQSGPGRLYAPLWIDCVGHRAAAARTWRQLTVADSRRILAPWQAVGFRVQAGDEQWLVYRALDAPRNRTVLGCNLACDFLVGRIKPRGLVARILEIV